MKNLAFVFIILFGCTSTSQKEQTENTDSTASAVAATDDSPSEVAENTIEEEQPSEEEEEKYDSVFSTEPINLSRFAQYPLGFDSYESIVQYMKGKNIEFTDEYVNDVQKLTFKRSYINILIAEAYGDLICSAEVYCSCYELGEGVRIGMPLDNFLSRTSLTRDSLEGFDDDLVYTRREGGTNVGGTSTIRMYFKNGRLAGIDYGFDPCMIYD